MVPDITTFPRNAFKATAGQAISMARRYLDGFEPIRVAAIHAPDRGWLALAFLHPSQAYMAEELAPLGVFGTPHREAVCALPFPIVHAKYPL